MRTLQEIQRRYLDLMSEVKNKPYYKVDLEKRVNCYVCKSCKHITKTKDVDPGVTPATIDCEKCGDHAFTTFFKDVAPGQQPTFEWYRPSLEELLTLRQNIDLLEHILKGGLRKRKIV